jgi:hypothetical protein
LLTGSGEPAESSEKAFGIDRAELVQSDETSSALKATRHSPGIGAPARRHRRDDHDPKMLVELIR